tara:strand:- start:27 stop:530 length:504 start_codon:yes stop_codon:yes gene_type:complete
MFDKLIEGIISIAEVCVSIVELLGDLIMWVVSMITNAPKFFDPVFIMQEIITGVFVGIKTMINGIVDIFTPSRFSQPKKCDNTGEGIFGFRRKTDKDGNVISNENLEKRKCVKPTLLRILLTMLCPPLGLFFHLGLNGFFHILVCTFLTIKLYYFPGFLYALMHIIC